MDMALNRQQTEGGLFAHHQPGGRHLRVRVESCVFTILDLNERLGNGKIKPEIIQQFERLKASLNFVTDDSVDERDIDRIEDATNQLLDQIRLVYGEENVGSLYEGQKH